MKVITKYLISEFIKLFVLCQIIFIAIYLIIDFIEKVDDFINAGASIGLMLFYFLNKSPFIINQMIPVATMISIIIMFWLMKKNNEIIAIKANGLDVLKISSTIIIISLIISVMAFLLSEIIVPITNSKSSRIWSIDVKKQDPNRFYGSNQIWYKSSNGIYWIRHYDSQKNIMRNPTFYFFDDLFNLIKRMDAKSAVWEEGHWRLQNGITQTLISDGSFRLDKFKVIYLEIPETPDVFLRGVKEPEDMSYWELKRLSEKIEQEGYDNTRYLVDLDLKIAYPLVVLILAILGIPLSLNLQKGGAPLAVSLGIFICFVYLFVFGLFRSLGIAGILPHLISAWSANLLFLFFGLFLVMKIER